MQGMVLKTEVVSPCAVAPFPSPGVTGHMWGCPGGWQLPLPGSSHAYRTWEGQKQGMSTSGVLAYQGWADSALVGSKIEKGNEFGEQRHTQEEGSRW